MAITFFSGFESGDSSGLLALIGTGSIQGTTKRTGDYALRTNPTTTNIGYARIVGIAADGQTATFDLATVVLGFGFRVATLPAANSEEIGRVDTSASAQKFVLRITSGGLIAAYSSDGTTLLATGTTVIATDTWYYLELSVGTGATAAYSLKINGATEFSGTADLGVTNNGAIRLGKVTNRNGNDVDFFYDDLYIADESLGIAYVQRMDGNLDGNYTDWDSSSLLASPSKYQDALGTPHDSDTTYLSTSTSGAAFTSALESASSAGISGTVRAVIGMLIVRDEGGASSFKVRLRSGSTDSDSTANDPGSSYVARQKILSTDPATSAAWTLSALDSLEVGVVAGAAVAHRCTAMWAMVLYTPVTAGKKATGMLLLGVG